MLTMMIKRMWRHRRVMAMQLLALSFATAFFALGPLYLRVIAKSALGYTIDQSPPGRFDLLLYNTDESIGETYAPIVDEELPGLVREIQPMTRLDSTACGRLNEPTPSADLAMCLEVYAYLPVTYTNMQALWTLTEGDWPVLMPDDGVQSQAVITAAVASQTRLAVGDRLTFGRMDNPVVVEIAGIVEPVDGQSPFWSAQGLVTTGFIINVTSDFQRFDFGLIMPEAGFHAVSSRLPSKQMEYLWYGSVDLEVLRAAALDGVETGLQRMSERFRQIYPSFEVRGQLEDLVLDIQANIRAAEGPVVLLAALVLLLMLYQLMTTASLVLEQQRVEWASMTSRGSSTLQMIWMQLFTVGSLGLIAAVIGPVIAYGMVLLMGQIGPLAAILNRVAIQSADLPPISIGLSFAAALVAVLLLTLPAWANTRLSILSLRQSVSRPPVQPGWARYFIDVILLLIGIALVVRLTLFIGTGDGLALLVQNPAALVVLIASSADELQLLNDPFNLAAVGLVLAGISLLWLRVFMLGMHFIGAIFSRLNGLMLPLALWSIERNPRHYAQLITLLIGTLALGLASLMLAATHDTGARQLALAENGAAVRVQLEAMQTDWQPDNVPGLLGAVPVVRAVTGDRSLGLAPTTLIGVDGADVLPLHPETAPVFASLENGAVPVPDGVALPEDAVEVRIQVWPAAVEGDTVRTRLAAEFENELGVRYTLPMTTEDETVTGRYVTYTGEIPQENVHWRLVGLRFTTDAENSLEFMHTAYLDEIVAVTQDGQVTTLENFEDEMYTEWTRLNQNRSRLIVAVSPLNPIGLHSLQVVYAAGVQQNLWDGSLLVIDANAETIVHVVVSQAFADAYGKLVDRRRLMEVGDRGEIPLELAQGALQMQYQVVGITRDFPTMQPRDLFMITHPATLVQMLNELSSPDDFYTVNEWWLNTADFTPSAEVRAALDSASGLSSVTYAESTYNLLRRDPLTNAIIGVLFAGFWLSLCLGLLDFAFFLITTANQRAAWFAVLRAIGWDTGKVWGLLTVEQVVLLTPTLLIGSLLGVLLAYFLLPFLALLGSAPLQIPVMEAGLLIGLFTAVFLLLLILTAFLLQRMSMNRALRLVEE